MHSIMKSNEDYTGYKQEILHRLHHRNGVERKPYEEIILLTTRQSESINRLQNENNKLNDYNDKLQSGVDPGSFISEKIDTLKRRNSALQEELVGIYGENREYERQEMKLLAALHEKDKIIAEKKIENKEVKASLAATEDLLKQVQQKLADIEEQRQFIREEYASLRNTFESMEQKMQELEKTTCLHRSKEDAQQVELETELIISEKEAEFQKEIEIAKEAVVIDTYKIENIVHFDPILPSKGRFKFQAHESEVTAVAWTSGCKFATAGADRKVKLWDFVSGQGYLEGVAHESKSTIYSVDFNNEDTLILAASYNGACRIWTINDMKLKQTLNGHSNKVMSAKFFGESGKVVSGSYDRTLKIWDLGRRACIRTISAGSSVNDVATRYAYGTNIVSGHFDKKIRFWDERCDYCIEEILLQGRITSLDLSSDGNSLLCSVRDDSLQLIDIRMNNVVRVFRSDGFLFGSDWTRAKFSPHGEMCVCGSQKGDIYIWDVNTGELKKVLGGHRSTVIACAWSMCGRYLLSCDKNKYAILRFEY